VQIYGPVLEITPNVQDNVNLCIDLGQKSSDSPRNRSFTFTNGITCQWMIRCFIHAL